MRISRQIGWSTEANLIYELIRQTEKLTITYGQKQPGFHVPISKPLSLSTESNLYYEWLRSLCKFTAQVANCCSTTTTTTTTTTTALPSCNCYCVTNSTESAISATITPCVGDPYPIDIDPGVTISGCFINVVPDSVGLTITTIGSCDGIGACPSCPE